MKVVTCENCGSKDLYEEDGFYVCKYCGTKFLITADDKPIRESIIDLNDDIARLLQRCKDEPERAKKCAERVLEIDPNNEEAKRILVTNEGNLNGCYVATAVYGSYDCSEVWTLRRFRDYVLAKTWYGRMFIHIYYTISPTLVKWFGKTAWFKKMWKPRLDSMVTRLNAAGIKNTPYQDRNW